MRYLRILRAVQPEWYAEEKASLSEGTIFVYFRHSKADTNPLTLHSPGLWMNLHPYHRLNVWSPFTSMLAVRRSECVPWQILPITLAEIFRSALRDDSDESQREARHAEAELHIQSSFKRRTRLR